MHKPRGERGSDIDYYAGSNVTAGALALLGHPVLHSVKMTNHRLAEGIEVESPPVGQLTDGDDDLPTP